MRCERLGPNQLYENHLAEAILHYGDEGDIPSNGQYQNIANEAESNDKWCRMNEGCVAVNCPFENFPSQYGITNCISVDKLRVLPNTVSEADPMVYTTDEDKTIFFNFGFEGDSSTSTINGRNFRFPSEPPQLTNNRPIPSACNDNIRCSERINRLVTEECRCTHVRRIDPDQTYRFVFTAVGIGRLLVSCGGSEGKRKFLPLMVLVLLSPSKPKLKNIVLSSSVVYTIGSASLTVLGRTRSLSTDMQLVIPY